MSFWDEKEAKRLFQKFPFYSVSIKKPRKKHRLATSTSIL